MQITKFKLCWKSHNSNKKALVAAWEVYAVDDLLMIENPISIRIMGPLSTGSRRSVNIDALVSVNNDEGFAKASDPTECGAIDAALALVGIEFDRDLVTEEDVVDALTLVAREMGYNNDISVRRPAIWVQKRSPRK